MSNKESMWTKGLVFLLVFLVFALIPVPEGNNLSGRNWSIGFPFGYFELRQNFPGVNYGGMRNFYALALAINGVLSVICVYCLKRLSVRYFAGRERAAFWLLTACVITFGNSARPSTLGAFDSFLATSPGIAWSGALIVVVGTAFCLLGLMSLAREGRSSKLTTND